MNTHLQVTDTKKAPSDAPQLGLKLVAGSPLGTSSHIK